MNFSNLKEWTTPRGNVVELAINGKIAWKKVQNVPINTLSVGSSVFLNVNGVRTEFLIVHQGLPASSSKVSYDSSCEGAWLLMKNIYEKRAWDSVNNDYAESDIHNYLKNTFINLFDDDIKGIIKTVRIPYRKGYASSGVPANGANGLSTKVFLLSMAELGEPRVVNYEDGTRLDYFSRDNTSNQIAYFDGVATAWWSRSANSASYNYVDYVNVDGKKTLMACTNNAGVRPALVLPSDTLVDASGNVIA